MADDGASNARDDVRAGGGAYSSARAVYRGRVRRRTPRLAAPDVDRARGACGRSSREAGADPAADVQLRRPPAPNATAPLARRHPRGPARRHRSRGHLYAWHRRRQRRANHPGDGRRLLLSQRRDTRHAGAAQHSRPVRDARPWCGRGQLRDRIGARRAVLPTADRPDRAAATQLRGSSSAVRSALVEQGAARMLSRGRRTIRLGKARSARRVHAQRPSTTTARSSVRSTSALAATLPSTATASGPTWARFRVLLEPRRPGSISQARSLALRSSDR